MTLFLHDRPFLRRMLALALPVSVQLLISTSINMADTVMISSLGGASIAAVGLVNQFVFFFMVVSFGICSAGAVFFAQYFGSRDMLNVRRYLSIALQLAVSVALVFMVISLLFPERIMRLLIPDPEVIRLGTGYLQIIALTFVFTGISQCFNTVLRSVNRANEPLKVSVIAFFTNVFFNYIFIFGKFGAPAGFSFFITFSAAASEGAHKKRMFSIPSSFAVRFAICTELCEISTPVIRRACFAASIPKGPIPQYRSI
jgi:Na+-driven multidrug efflux pump